MVRVGLGLGEDLVCWVGGLGRYVGWVDLVGMCWVGGLGRCVGWVWVIVVDWLGNADRLDWVGYTHIHIPRRRLWERNCNRPVSQCQWNTEGCL